MNTENLKINGRIWIETDEKFIGLGRVELLELIDELGSINKAAQQMGMSYKKANQLVSSMNVQSEKPLIIVQIGGENGGGATISDDARQLIKFYKDLQQKFKVFLQNEEENLQKLI
jgi:molybdate transport system regulatory protein